MRFPKRLRPMGTMGWRISSNTIEVIEHCESEFDIKVRFLASINRTVPVECAKETFDIIKEIKSPYIVGFELSGDA